MKNVLAVGAHPDDVEFGAGGTLRKHVLAGDRVTILTMSCSDCMNIYGETVKQGDIRKKEAENAARILGAELILLDFNDQLIPFDRNAIFAIEKVLKRLKTDTIYTHWNGDSHQDHINTLKSVLAAARFVDSIFLYEQVPLPRVGKILSEVNYYVDISDVFDIKEQASFAHESQVRYKYDDRVMVGMRALAEFRGSQCNCKYAEAFDSVKQIIRS